MPLLALLAAFAGAFFLGTLVEYSVHRLMHRGKLLGKKHAEHHKDGWGQGWFGEFWDYFLGTTPILIGGLLLGWLAFDSLAGGIGWVAGGLTYAALAAYAHQLQHEKPELVFWLPRPIHHLHHKYHMWKHNFGILVDFWDRIFGTYQRIEWKPEKRPFQYPLRSFWQIKWF
jgi:sterol desaturase/sphingolipid hydroxylase (fatty acid hydroxylase superfamily)